MDGRVDLGEDHHLQEITFPELPENIEVKNDTIAGVLHKMMEASQLRRRRKGKQKVVWSLDGNGKRQRTKDEGNPSKTGSRFSTGSQESEENGKRLFAGNSITCPVENKPVLVSPPYARAGTGFPQAQKKSGKQKAVCTHRNPTVKLNRKTDCRDGNDTEVWSSGKT